MYKIGFIKQIARKRAIALETAKKARKLTKKKKKDDPSTQRLNNTLKLECVLKIKT
jgi:hypothetical protein